MLRKCWECLLAGLVTFGGDDYIQNEKPSRLYETVFKPYKIII